MCLQVYNVTEMIDKIEENMGWVVFECAANLRTWAILSLRSSVCLLLVFGLAATGLLGNDVDNAGAGAKKQWEIPAGGNSYFLSSDRRAGDRILRNGKARLGSEDGVLAIYFRTNRHAFIDMKLALEVPEGVSSIRVSSGEVDLTREVEAGGVREVPFGRLVVEDEGYVKVEIHGVKKSGDVFAVIDKVILEASEPDLELVYVRNNEGNRFYWGRRGPSVHLGYQMPEDKQIEWAYSEVTVATGDDPIGSYFMANGFGQGYFGIQVNGPDERRVLFSVWSPFSTDDPKEIPEDQRIILLGKGEGVYSGEFGNEGSGGQSYLVYPWKSGKTYRFLTRIRPDGKGNTEYTGWFGEKPAPGSEGEWQLIASFRRPKTDTYYTRFHSFLENFSAEQGHYSRRSLHGNQWVCDVDGQWHELTKAKFTGDDIARRGFRVDYAGGLAEGAFFMKNGGFFDETVELNSEFSRRANPEARPKIDFRTLPKK